MTRLTCISDLHGFYPELKGGDLLIISGDITASDKLTQWANFFHWLKEQNYEKKILIGGNHDNFLETAFPKNKEETEKCQEILGFLDYDDSLLDFEYLCDSGTEYNGLKIWGSPWTLKFKNMNPKCMAFTVDTETELEKYFSKIPIDTNILITHSPPKGILDVVNNKYHINISVGSTSLLEQIQIVLPSHVIFGHIHESGSKIIKMENGTTFINCSYVNERYKPVNKPITIEL